MTVPTSAPRTGLRAVALLEAFKASLVLLAGFGAFALIHRDVQALAESLVRHLHLNPARHVPLVFLKAASRVTDTRLWTLSAGALLYAAVRFAESWGLWRARVWAEWLGALSGSIYVPFEIVSLLSRPTPLKAAALVVNVVVVAYLAFQIGSAKRRHAQRT